MGIVMCLICNHSRDIRKSIKCQKIDLENKGQIQEWEKLFCALWLAMFNSKWITFSEFQLLGNLRMRKLGHFHKHSHRHAHTHARRTRARANAQQPNTCILTEGTWGIAKGEICIALQICLNENAGNAIRSSVNVYQREAEKRLDLLALDSMPTCDPILTAPNDITWLEHINVHISFPYHMTRTLTR